MAREPGLRVLNQSKRTRHRQIVTGRAAIGGGIPPKLFLVGIAALLIAGFFYYRADSKKLEEQRGTLLAGQRAMESTLGPRLRPLRDQLERAALELSRDPMPKDQVDLPEELDRLLVSPGIYLRLRLEDARAVESMRKGARSSLRDAFSSCLFRDPKGIPVGEGKACRESIECEAGELCTEFSVCQRPATPFNMKLLYRALSVLEPGWVAQVRTAKSDLALVALERMLESVTRVDVPLAIEVFQRARFALVLLDESPSEGAGTERGAEESDADYAQRVPHGARVGIWSLPEGTLWARAHLDARGELRDVGSAKANFGPEAERTRARQAQSCAFAMELKGLLARSPSEAIGEPSARTP